MNKLYAGLLSISFLGSASLISANVDDSCHAVCAVKIFAEVTDSKNLDMECGCNKPKPNREVEDACAKCGCNKPRPNRENSDSQDIEESDATEAVDKNLDLECGCSKPKPNREVSEDTVEEAAEQN